jgi:hypothetical protein
MQREVSYSTAAIHHITGRRGKLTLVLVLAAHHEARDVLQEEERNLALAAQLDEVRRLCV